MYYEGLKICGKWRVQSELKRKGKKSQWTVFLKVVLLRMRIGNGARQELAGCVQRSMSKSMNEVRAELIGDRTAYSCTDSALHSTTSPRQDWTSQPVHLLLQISVHSSVPPPTCSPEAANLFLTISFVAQMAPTIHTWQQFHLGFGWKHRNWMTVCQNGWILGHTTMISWSEISPEFSAFNPWTTLKL